MHCTYPDKFLFSVPEAAEALSVAPITVHRRVKSGVWPSVTIGRRRLVSRDTLERIASGELFTSRPEAVEVSP